MSELHPISGCENAKRKADVVFIHGLGGDAFTTWRHGKDASTSWPHWLGKEFPEVGVWSLGYAASPTRWAKLLPLIGRGSRDSGHSMALPDRALQVLDLMTQQGLGERPCCSFATASAVWWPSRFCARPVTPATRASNR